MQVGDGGEHVGDMVDQQAVDDPVPAALLAGVPLPAKANLLTRWERKADREAGYVRLPSPLAEGLLSETVHDRDTWRDAR
jgi:hypothetical protein